MADLPATVVDPLAERERLSRAQAKGASTGWAEGNTRVGDIVYFHPGAGQPNYAGQVLAAEVVKLLPDGHVNLSVRHPEGCGCFFLRDVPQADGGPLDGSWSHRE